MKNLIPLPLQALLLFLSIMLLDACTPGVRLRTIPADQPPRGENYSLLLHGCSFGNDPSTVAFILPREQADKFEVYSPEFQYRFKSGLSAAQALSEGEYFINCSPHFSHSRLLAILDRENHLLGYELRPLYQQSPVFRQEDILDVLYFDLGEGRIRIYVEIPREVEVELEEPETR